MNRREFLGRTALLSAGATLGSKLALHPSVAWAAGEIPLVIVMLALLVQWARSDERTARRLDRAAHLERVARWLARREQELQARLARELVATIRQLNRAIHIIALSRAKTDPETRAYLARKQAEGKTKLEAIRCLKRHLARRIWRLLYTAESPAAIQCGSIARKPEIPNFT